MKHKLLLCGIGVFLFFSCKKEKHTPDTKLYPVSFNVADFTQNQIPLGLGKTKTAALGTNAAPAQRLIYMLFLDNNNHNAQNPLVSLQKTTTGDPGFGTIIDNVAPGKYLAVFAGGSAGMNILYDSGPSERRYYISNAGRLVSNSPCYWGDTFYKRIPITVTASGINMGVSLDRMTGQLNLVIKDAIPAGVSRITVSFTDTIALRAVDRAYIESNPAKNGADNTISATDIGKTNYTITMNVLRNNIPFDVTVNYYGPANPLGPLGTKIIKNVACKMNTRTTLSGNLFTPGNSEFAITINQDWNTPITGDF